jgi:hypothetical protein
MRSLIIRALQKAIRVITPPVKTEEVAEEPPSIQAIRVIPWFNDRGDQTHRLNYELDANSVVFDLGGYEGEWARDIYCLYGSFIYIFEPYQVY